MLYNHHRRCEGFCPIFGKQQKSFRLLDIAECATFSLFLRFVRNTKD